jgi:hypothetical protein
MNEESKELAALFRDRVRLLANAFDVNFLPAFAVRCWDIYLIPAIHFVCVVLTYAHASGASRAA